MPAVAWAQTLITATFSALSVLVPDSQRVRALILASAFAWAQTPISATSGTSAISLFLVATSGRKAAPLSASPVARAQALHRTVSDAAASTPGSVVVVSEGIKPQPPSLINSGAN